MSVTELRFTATTSSGTVSALWQRPRGARCLYVFAHGAGAGMHHPFMEQAAEGLAAHGIATFRFQFPYMEQGKRAPSPGPVLQKTVRSAVAEARRLGRGLPVFAGGKSMGGRMTSLAQSREPLDGVLGLVFFGFPLHAAGKPSAERGDHLGQTGLPLLFLQGSRDRLADLDLLRPLCRSLKPKPELYVVEEGDHSFKVPKRTGRSHHEVIEDLCRVTAEWMRRCLS